VPDATDLHALCEELLDASVEALDTIPAFAPGLAGAPGRSYVSPGLPALDCCDQLTVHAASIADAVTSPGALSAGRKIAAKINQIGLQVTITRCIPVVDDSGTLPTAEEMAAAAEQTNADAWALWNHLYNLWRADLLFSLCGEVFWDGMRSLNPQGGCGGWVLSLRVSLSGYEEALGS
jgi:hypothetical protein